MSSTRTTSGPASTIARTDAGASIDVAEQLELAALAQADRDRFHDQRVVRHDNQSLHRTSCPHDLHVHRSSRMVINLIAP